MKTGNSSTLENELDDNILEFEAYDPKLKLCCCL